MDGFASFGSDSVTDGQGDPLPPADANGTINLAGASGKVVLVTGTESLGCNGGSTPCSPAQLDRVVDLVGYGSANFSEGSAAAPTLSNSTAAALRLEAGCVDTDDNAADFRTGTPSPRNTSTATAECGVPAVASFSPADGAENVSLDAAVVVTFTSPMAVSGEWFTIVCTASGDRTAGETGGPVSWTLEVEGEFEFGETCTVTILASQVRPWR